MSNTQIHPYLIFSGRCEEALEFYKSALGATIDMVMRFSESPDPTPEGMLQPGFENKIMHSSFHVGENMIMASDGCGDTVPFNGCFSLSISLSSEKEVDRVFNALADGGEIRMAPGKTFWSSRFGMVKDRFGVGWMVMTAAE